MDIINFFFIVFLQILEGKTKVIDNEKTGEKKFTQCATVVPSVSCDLEIKTVNWSCHQETLHACMGFLHLSCNRINSTVIRFFFHSRTFF